MREFTAGTASPGGLGAAAEERSSAAGSAAQSVGALWAAQSSVTWRKLLGQRRRREQPQRRVLRAPPSSPQFFASPFLLWMGQGSRAWQPQRPPVSRAPPCQPRGHGKNRSGITSHWLSPGRGSQRMRNTVRAEPPRRVRRCERTSVLDGHVGELGGRVDAEATMGMLA